MYKKAIVLLCMLLGVTSCYKYSKPEKPENLISKEKMAHILLDLKFIEAVTGRDKKVLDSAKVNPEGYIYKKYNIDSTQFAQSNAYYAYFMEDYNQIYTNVKDSLNKLKKHYKALADDEALEKRKQDSLKRIQTELETLEIDIDLDAEEIQLIEPVSDTD